MQPLLADDMLSMREASKLLGVSRLTVARHFPTIKLGRRRLVRRSVILAVINGGGHAPA